MLTILLLIPFLGALAISVLPPDDSGRNRSLALLVLAAQCVYSFALLIPFQSLDAGQQLVDSVPWLPVVGLDFSLGVDGLSLPLVLMNAVLCLVAAPRECTIWAGVLRFLISELCPNAIFPFLFTDQAHNIAFNVWCCL